MLTRSLIVAAVLACVVFPLSGAQAGSKTSSHNEKSATSHKAPGNGAVAKKADQKQAKKDKKRKPIEGDSSDYLVIKLQDASVMQH